MSAKLAAFILAVAVLSGCLDWDAESAALRLAHVQAVENAAPTDQFDVIPPLEEWP